LDGSHEVPYQVTTSDVQKAVGEVAREKQVTIVGYHVSDHSTVTLTRWPESRAGYRPSPSDEACEIALQALRARLDGRKITRNVIGEGMVHSMIGRKLDGYTGSELAPVAIYSGEDALPFNRIQGYMVSARVLESGDVEPYGEEVVAIQTSLAHRAILETVGVKARQHHIAIEYGPSNYQGSVSLLELQDIA
jgi:hypothetical protein